MKRLINLLDAGWNIQFINQPKRIDGDFIIRLIWKAENGIYNLESEWEGFDLSEECLNDCLETLEKIDIGINNVK